MATDTFRYPSRSSSDADEPRERLAALIAAERAPILRSYAASLESMRGSLATEPRIRDQTISDASNILSDIAATVRGNAKRIGDRYEMPAWITGGAAAERQVNPADLVRAAVGFFDITISAIARHVEDDPALMPHFVTAVLALNECISNRVREAILANTSYLLERVDQAHVDERRRIARDLHDRLGEGLSAALRQLELHEITNCEDPPTLSPWAAKAKNTLTEAMQRLRVVTSGLRQDSIRSLETALVQYIDSVAADADVRLRVSGDETWAPPAVIEEAFLIIREAVRNALRHGAPQMVLIGVAFAPYELHAWVEDDGRGFASDAGGDASAGTGLASMRERTDLIGGRLTIASAPGHGARVELLVPLRGHRDG